jgi:hypothetical protein
VIYAALMACWLIALLRASPAWVRALNRGGAALGRAVAWFCSGGLGWKLARFQIEAERSSEAMAALMARWRPYAASRSSGLAQVVSPSLADQLDAYEPALRASPARCEVCGLARFRCPRCLHLDAGRPSPVACSGMLWGAL